MKEDPIEIFVIGERSFDAAESSHFVPPRPILELLHLGNFTLSFV